MAAPEPKTPPAPWRPSEEDLRRRRSRSLALGLALGALALLFFIVTIAKLGGNVFNRAL